MAGAQCPHHGRDSLGPRPHVLRGVFVCLYIYTYIKHVYTDVDDMCVCIHIYIYVCIHTGLCLHVENT